MRLEQIRWPTDQPSTLRDAHLVLVFGERPLLESSRWYEDLRRRYPRAHVVAASTAGEILDTEVGDLGIVATAIQFEQTAVRVHRVNVREFMDTETAGEYLARGIEKKDLAHVMILCDGQHVNGSQLVRGISKHLPKRVALTGGLAGDGARFQRTYLCANGPPIVGSVAAIAFYGSALRVGYGSLGGWDSAGDEMRITRARGNVVEQLDGQPALAKYAELLGDDAAGLPASGLRYPLEIRTADGRTYVRTLLAVDPRCQTLTFAGDVPVGSYARPMKANFDRLVAGASGAASNASEIGQGAELAILISCVGRRLVLGPRTKDEVAAVRKVLGDATAVAGFYSYGEICPAAPDASCELHNQTMTITTLREA